MATLTGWLIIIYMAVLSVGVSAVDDSPNIQSLARSINYLTEDYAPGNFIKRSKLIGVSADTLRLVWQKLGIPEQEVDVIPWSRAYRDALNNKMTMLFSVARTEEREAEFKWVGPIYDSTHVLVSKTSSDIQIKKLQDAFDYRTAVLRNDIAEFTLRKNGFPSLNLVQVAELPQAYLMLRSGRVDLMGMTTYGLRHILDRYQEQQDKYQISWRIIKVDNYYAFHRDTPDILIQAFQQAFDSIQDKRNEIKKRYGLPTEGL